MFLSSDAKLVDLQQKWVALLNQYNNFCEAPLETAQAKFVEIALDYEYDLSDLQDFLQQDLSAEVATHAYRLLEAYKHQRETIHHGILTQNPAKLPRIDVSQCIAMMSANRENRTQPANQHGQSSDAADVIDHLLRHYEEKPSTIYTQTFLALGQPHAETIDRLNAILKSVEVIKQSRHNNPKVTEVCDDIVPQIQSALTAYTDANDEEKEYFDFWQWFSQEPDNQTQSPQHPSRSDSWPSFPELSPTSAYAEAKRYLSTLNKAFTALSDSLNLTDLVQDNQTQLNLDMAHKHYHTLSELRQQPLNRSLQNAQLSTQYTQLCKKIDAGGTLLETLKDINSALMKCTTPVARSYIDRTARISANDMLTTPARIDMLNKCLQELQGLEKPPLQREDWKPQPQPIKQEKPQASSSSCKPMK
jgi:hypothetical protein